MSISSSTRLKPITITLSIIAVGILFQCSVDRENKIFEELVDSFFAEYIKFFPIQECGMGLQDCNDRFNNYSPEHISDIITTFQSFDRSIKTIDKNNLSSKNQVNYDLLIRQIDLILFENEKLQRWQYDVAFYTEKIYQAFVELLTCQHCREQEKSTRLLKRLQALPGFIAQAKENLASNNVSNCQSATEEIENIKKIVYFYLPQELTTIIPGVDSLNSMIEMAINSLESFELFLKRKHDVKANEASFLTAELYQNYLQLSLNADIDIQSLLQLISSDFQNHYDQMMSAAEQYLIKNGNFENKKSSTNIIALVDEELEKHTIQKQEIIPFCLDVVRDAKRFVNEIWNISLPIDFSVDFNWAQDELIPRQEILYLQPPNLFQTRKQFNCHLQPIPGDKDWIHQLVFLRKFHKNAVTIEVILNALVSHYKIWFNNSDKIPVLAKALPDQTFLNGWSYFLAFSMLENGYAGYDPALNYVLLKKYCRMLFIAQLEIQHRLGPLSRKQMEGLLKSSSLFKKNEIDELSRKITCFPGESIITFWGYHQLTLLEQASRKKTGSQFNIDFFLNHVLDLGPVPFSLVNKHVTQLFEDR